MAASSAPLNYLTFCNNINSSVSKKPVNLPFAISVGPDLHGPLYVNLDELKKFIEKQINNWIKTCNSHNKDIVLEHLENLKKYLNYIVIVKQMAVQASIMINGNIIDIRNMINIIKTRKQENQNTINKEYYFYIPLELYDCQFSIQQLPFHNKELDICYIILEITKVMAAHEYGIIL
jgi:hypothetical protein